MTTIGSQLSEARKRQGKSIRDASDALKIKIDFLSNFENDRFDFDLPEVYMYGFLKLYARYLKLDHKVIMAQYSELKQLNIHHSRARESRELFGRMHLAKKPQLLADPVNTHFKVLEDDIEESFQSGEDEPLSSSNSTLFRRPMIWGGSAALVGIVCIIVAIFWNSSESETSQALDTAMPTQSASNQGVLQDTIALTSETEVHIIVRQESNKQRLFSGTLAPKEVKVIDRTGPVKIHFSDGSSLIIKKANGEKVKPARSGVGWVEVN